MIPICTYIPQQWHNALQEATYNFFKCHTTELYIVLYKYYKELCALFIVLQCHATTSSYNNVLFLVW